MKKTLITSLAAAAAVALCGTARADLPAGYKQLEYIESDGNQRIKTGYTPADCKEKFELRLMFSKVSGTQTLWCSRGSGTQTRTMTTFLISSKLRYDRNTNTSKSSTLQLAANKIYTASVDYKARKGSVTDESAGTTSETTELGSGDFTPGSAVGLLASHHSGVDSNLGNWGYFRIYHFKVTKSDGTTGCHFIPVVRTSDGVLGLYDIAGGKGFVQKTNKSGSTASFKAGPVVLPSASDMSATWSNTAGDGALDNPSNWSGNEVPASGATVAISLSGDVTLTSASELAFSTMVVTGSGSAVFPSNITATDISLAANVAATFPSVGTLVDYGLSGAGTFILDPGAGNTATMTKSNTGFTGDAVIKSGTVKMGNATSFGSAGIASVRVKDEATFDMNEASAANWTGKKYISTVLEGGATITTSSVGSTDPNVTSAVTDLTLEGDAVMDNNGKWLQFGQPSYQALEYAHIYLNEHTLTLTGSNINRLSVCAIEGTGTVDVVQGTLALRGASSQDNGSGSYRKLQPACTNGTVRIRAGARLLIQESNSTSYNTTATIKDLWIDGTAETSIANNILKVTGSLTGTGTVQRVTLDANAVFKPTGTGYLTFTTALTLPSGTMTIDLSSFDLTDPAFRDGIPLFKVGSAAMLPSASAIAGKPNGWSLATTADELGYDLVPIPPAVWTNAMNDCALDNVANWTRGGNAVSELPADDEEVFVTIDGDMTLTSSATRNFSAMTLTGSGSAVFPATVTAAGISIPADVAATFPSVGTLLDYGLSGEGTFILDLGAGNTATMTKNNTGFTGETIIKSGTLKTGNSTSFGPAGIASVRVKNGATLDMNEGYTMSWTGNKYISTVLEGGATLTSSTAQSDTNGTSDFSELTLEGDATMDNGGKSVRFGHPAWQANTYAHVNLGTNTFTLVGSGTNAFYICQIEGTGMIDATEGTLVLRGGGRLVSRQLLFTNGTVRVHSGAKLFVDKGYYNSTATVKNLILDGEATTHDANNILKVTGSLSGNGTMQRVTLDADAVFKPTGTGYLTITTALKLSSSGTMTIDLSELTRGGRVPLFKVGSASMLPAESAIVGLPVGWRLLASKEGIGYDIEKKGFSIYIR